jgi:hypothetical protein
VLKEAIIFNSFNERVGDVNYQRFLNDPSSQLIPGRGVFYFKNRGAQILVRGKNMKRRYWVIFAVLGAIIFFLSMGALAVD